MKRLTARIHSALLLVCAALLAAAQPAVAQTPDAAAAAKLFTSAGDVSALIERAKRERKPDQANFVQPVVQLASYRVNLEYRMPGLSAPATVHEKDIELFFVAEGVGTAVTGGTLRDGRRTNEANLAGTGIDGGTSRRIGKGDVLVVPANTPHWFAPVDGPLVLMSLHVPAATQ
jgi:mannose-6-phosphate isomerase-like protein (cupin superfamily)